MKVLILLSLLVSGPAFAEGPLQPLDDEHLIVPLLELMNRPAETSKTPSKGLPLPPRDTAKAPAPAPAATGAAPVTGAASALSQAFNGKVPVELPPVTVTASPLEPEVLNTPIPPRFPTSRNCESTTGYGQPHPNFAGTYNVYLYRNCQGTPEQTAWILETNGRCMANLSYDCRWYVENDEIVIILVNAGLIFRGRAIGSYSLSGRMTAIRDCSEGCWSATIYTGPSREQIRENARPVHEPTRQQQASPN